MEHTLRRVLWVVVLVSVEAAGEFMMPAIFKDGVVLQHTAANVFGFADPGQKVTVDVTDEKTTTTTTYDASLFLLTVNACGGAAMLIGSVASICSGTVAE